MSNHKGHLSYLPIPSPGHIPDWEPEGDSKYCVFIPLFSFFRNGELNESYVHGSTWALLTWKRFSDAQKYNVPCYIWLEEVIADEITAVLVNKFNVPPNCIVRGSAGPCQGISQAMGPIFDERFDKYETKIILDSEVLVIAPPGQPLRFFEALETGAPKGFGVAVKWVQETPLSESACKYWLRYHLPEGHSSLYDVELKNTEILKVAEKSWLETVKELTNETIRDHFATPGTPFNFNLGAVRVFTNAEMDMTWWARALTKLKDEEAALSIWEQIDPENHKVWEVADLPLDIEHAVSSDIKMYDYFMPIQRPFMYNFCNSAFGFLCNHFHEQLTAEGSL